MPDDVLSEAMEANNIPTTPNTPSTSSKSAATPLSLANNMSSPPQEKGKPKRSASATVTSASSASSDLVLKNTLMEHLSRAEETSYASQKQDEDDLFCLSMVASLRRMGPEQKSNAKIKIQTTLHDILYPAPVQQQQHINVFTPGTPQQQHVYGNFTRPSNLQAPQMQSNAAYTVSTIPPPSIPYTFESSEQDMISM